MIIKPSVETGAVVVKLGRQEEQMLSESSPCALSHILVPLDYSPCSKKALDYAIALSNYFTSGLLILHVVELFPVDYCFGVHAAIESNRWLSKQAQDWLNDIRNQFASPSGVAIEIMVTFGRPFREIARVAKEQNMQLIIICTHGYTGLKHLQFGSTTERVVRHAPCPVLVLREQEQEFAVFDKITAGKCA